MAFRTKEREILFMILCLWNSLDWPNKTLVCFVEQHTNYKYWFWTTVQNKESILQKEEF